MLYFRRIDGDSMAPSFRSGSLIVAVTKQPRKNDVVIVTVDGREVMKRIQDLTESKVYLVGDNAKNSTDSNTYGYIDRSAVIATVVLQCSWPRRKKHHP